MTLQWLLGWWNLIFVAPFAVALVYLFAATISGVGMGDGDADADADADVHGDAHADADADADADAEADADSAASNEAEQAPAHAAVLAWLGVGRAPLSLIALVLVLTWGAAGFVANAVVRPHAGWEAARVSVPVALAAGLLVTRSMVLLLARFIPLNQNLAMRRGDHVGEEGQAIHGIDERFGLVAVRDGHGDLKQLPCRVAAGVEPIPRGARVRLVAYRADERVFFVRRTD